MKRMSKNILFLAHHKWPRIGGVERHVDAVGHKLYALGYKTTTISSENIKYPHIKIIGLLYIWFWLLRNRKLIAESDLVHIHDVFIWYLPFRFLNPSKKVYITFHGWEGRWPLPMWAIINKRIANFLCKGSIAVGKYIEKYYRIKTDFVIYGGVNSKPQTLSPKLKNSVVWLGRQDKDTGIDIFHEWLSVNGQRLRVKYVTNIKNPQKYLKTAEYCVPSGYLSYLEAKSHGCKIMIFANNPLKEDYWKEIKLLKTIPTWDEVTGIYRKLWEK